MHLSMSNAALEMQWVVFAKFMGLSVSVVKKFKIRNVKINSRTRTLSSKRPILLLIFLEGDLVHNVYDASVLRSFKPR